MTDFQIFFSSIFGSKLSISEIRPHLKRVATLRCEKLMLEH